MAMLITKKNRPIFLSGEQANLLWLVKTGERTGTPKTKKIADSVEKWYLNYHTAPESYQDTHPPIDGPHRVRRLPQLSLPYKD